MENMDVMKELKDFLKRDFIIFCWKNTNAFDCWNFQLLTARQLFSEQSFSSRVILSGAIKAYSDKVQILLIFLKEHFIRWLQLVQSALKTIKLFFHSSENPLYGANSLIDTVFLTKYFLFQLVGILTIRWLNIWHKWIVSSE